MPPVHILAADKINADIAGLTGQTPVVEQPAATIGEIFDGEGFSGIFGAGTVGGFHPEAIPMNVVKELELATDSIQGRHGGMVPSKGSVLQPGPAGGSAFARMMQQARQLFSQ